MANTIYQQVKDTIEGMEIGDIENITLPATDQDTYLLRFRKHLSELSKARGIKFTTKNNGGILSIMRIKYSNIHSHEVE